MTSRPACPRKVHLQGLTCSLLLKSLMTIRSASKLAWSMLIGECVNPDSASRLRDFGPLHSPNIQCTAAPLGFAGAGLTMATGPTNTQHPLCQPLWNTAASTCPITQCHDGPCHLLSHLHCRTHQSSCPARAICCTQDTETASQECCGVGLLAAKHQHW